VSSLNRLAVAVVIVVAACALAAPVAVIPRPPKQDDEWTMPAGVQDPEGRIASVIEQIFALGMADPRGCSYRHVTVDAKGGEAEFRAWVLPEGEENARHAIGWSGLIHPVMSVGAPADLERDTRVILTKGNFDTKLRPNLGSDIDFDYMINEYVGTPAPSHAWAAPYLLLRLGRVDLLPSIKKFQKFLARRPVDPFEEYAGPAFQNDDPFGADTPGRWLVEWAFVLRANAMTAFLDGDDAISAQRARLFHEAWDVAHQQWPEQKNRLEVDPADPFGDRDGIGLQAPSDGFDVLMADVGRRLQPGEQVQPQGRAQRLIASWDQLRSWDGANLPLPVTEVIALGADAIPVLLECLRHDTRLTRVRYEVWGEYHTRILTVRDLAMMVLERILEYPVLSSELDAEQGFQPEAWYMARFGELAAFCKRHQNICGPELWYRVLRDDTVPPVKHWAAALLVIGSQNEQSVTPGFWFSRATYGYAIEGGHLANMNWFFVGEPMAGEALRDGRAPSVTDLLAEVYHHARKEAEQKELEGYYRRRSVMSGMIHETFPAPRTGAHQFILALEEWDPGARIDVLRQHFRWLREDVLEMLSLPEKRRPWTFVHRSWHCEKALMFRFAARDPKVFAEYRKLIDAYLDAGELWWLPLDPLVEYPRAKGMDALAEFLFSGPEAPFDMSRRPWVRGDDRSVVLRRGGLLASSSFRSTVLNGLRARDVQFSLTTTVSGCEFIFKGEENLWHFRPPQIPRAPDELGIVRQVRFCDLVAEFLCETSQLGPLKRKAQFRIDDPIEKRDIGIADWIALIQGVERRSTVD